MIKAGVPIKNDGYSKYIGYEPGWGHLWHFWKKL